MIVISIIIVIITTRTKQQQQQQQQEQKQEQEQQQPSLYDPTMPAVQCVQAFDTDMVVQKTMNNNTICLFWIVVCSLFIVQCTFRQKRLYFHCQFFCLFCYWC